MRIVSAVILYALFFFLCFLGTGSDKKNIRSFWSYPDKSAIQKCGARSRLLGSMIRKIRELDGAVTEFDAGLWGVFVETMTVMADGKKIVKFKDGAEVEVKD